MEKYGDMKKAVLYFENGLMFEAKSFGADGTFCGEIVFNTSMSGYQEILTDPSYAGQFVVFTMPEIGVVGVNEQDIESCAKKPYAKGVIVRNYNEIYSNFRASGSFGAYLKSHNIIGICDIDTRQLTKIIRKYGAMMIIASTEVTSKEELKKILESSPRIQDINYINEVGTQDSFVYENGVFSFEDFTYSKPKFSKKIIVIDFGLKQNILNELSSVGLLCEVINHKFNASEIIKRFKSSEIGGVFLSNGPGDPSILSDEISELKKLIKAKIPIFGICLGHQLLSIASGHPTEKLKFGHHGANHPVKNTQTNKVEITSQNHIYSVPDSIRNIAEVTHINLFDGTIEGVRYKNAPIISIQHHPEASPGPREARIIFREFFEMVKVCK